MASSERLHFRSDDVRVRVLHGGNAGSAHGRATGKFVLYWAQLYRRPWDNAALAYAIEQANALGLPCVVYEALRPDYPYASDRFHTFVLEGARDMARGLRERGLAYAFFLPRTPEEARGVLARVAKGAALVVTDDFPAYIVPKQNTALAAKVDCPFVVVDDAAGVPMALFGKQEHAARTLRPKVTQARAAWVKPLAEPEPRVRVPRELVLPFDPVDVERMDPAVLVASCAIDHGVPKATGFEGGSAAADARLERFVRMRLSAYAEGRNDPSRPSTSQLSPYLHFGMISARRVALAAMAHEREGGDPGAVEAFLEQLLVRRGLAFNFARANAHYDRYEAAVPAWARATLSEHQRDPRPAIVSRDALEAARSPDEIWNAAQLELLDRGVIHNYLRMLWGKLVLTWTARPEDAFAHLVYLNDKYALDGRDPDGYASIAWCFGLHDRPYPERAVFGKVRSMTSRSTRTKLDLDAYLADAEQRRRARS
jgi:deoxyribodipyrimidine photo-lyase